MLTGIETVWQRLKSAANEYAKGGVRLDMRQAETVVANLFRDEHVSPWPEADVIEFYACELLTLIDRDRSTAQ